MRSKIEDWSPEELENELNAILERRRIRLAELRTIYDDEQINDKEPGRRPHLTDEEYKQYALKEIVPYKFPPSKKPPLKAKFSMAEKTQIKKDWNKFFPEMGYSKKSMLLGKFVGPLFIYVSLSDKREWSARYKVGCGTHNYILFKYDLHIGIGGDAMPHVIEYYDHQEKSIEAANYLKKDLSILEGGPVTLEAIFESHARIHPKAIYHDSISTPLTLATWCGEYKKAKEYLDWGYKIIVDQYGDKNCHWYKYIKDYDILNRNLSLDLPFKEVWRQYMEDMLENPEMLRQIARNEIQRREWLRFAPYYDIKDAPYQEGNIWQPIDDAHKKKK